MVHIAGTAPTAIEGAPLDRASKARSIASRSRTIFLFVAPMPELLLALGFVLASMVVAQVFGLHPVFPNEDALQFTGMSFAVPLSMIFALGLFLIVTKQKARLAYYAITALSYIVILTFHFNMKLWMSLINNDKWDNLYWQSDQMVRPLIDASFVIHNSIDAVLPVGNHLYLFAFLAMFACSIVVHSTRSFLVFRKVIFTSMLVHFLGAFSYLIAPAVGPFIYEAGVNALETTRQEHMYGGYQALVSGGMPWIASEGSVFLFSGVAAMPSLHVASSAVFVYFAWKYARKLCWLYLPLFAFIMIEAVATRWHYVIDLAAGLALTGVAILITTLLFRPIEAYHAKQRSVETAG